LTKWVDAGGFAGVESLYGLRRPLYNLATFSAAFLNVKGSKKILRARFQFGRKDDGLEHSEGSRTYGDLFFERRNLGPDEGVELARRLTSGTELDPSLGVGVLKFPERVVTRSAGDILPQPFPARAGLLWPSFQFYFTTGPTQDVSDVSGPIVAPNEPPILEPWRVVNRWLGMDFNLWPVNSRNFLEIVIPDLRGAIRKITFGEDNASVDLDIPDWSSNGLRFTAASTDGNTETELPVSTTPESISFKPGPPWSQLAFFVMAQDGSEVIDWAQLHSTIPYSDQYVNWSVPEKQLQRLIEEWETQTVEFKASAADLGDVVQSVVAFANSNDGAIIIGVNEARDIVGVGKPEKVEERIRQAISEFCDPTVNPTFSTLEVLGRSILIVSLGKGSQRPYVHRGRGSVYIRRGAFDFPTKSRKELDDLYPA
jgi:hypothetical protein